MDKLEGSGTTLDSGTEQTRETMHGAALAVVPKRSSSGPADGTELSPAQKEKIEANSRKKMDYLQAEYWRVRTGRQDYLRCPYCVKGRHGRRKNFVDGAMCCVLFAKAFGAILDRQNQIDEAQRHASNIVRLGQMVGRAN